MVLIALLAPLSMASDDKAQIKKLLDDWCRAFDSKDLKGALAFYDPNDVFVYDVTVPREFPNFASLQKDYEDFFAAFPGPIHDKIDELNITVAGDVAYSHYVDDMQATAGDGTTSEIVMRVTDVYRKKHGKWAAVLEHISVPVDLTTGKPDLLSKP